MPELHLCFAESVVRINKHLNHCSQCLQSSRKTSAATCEQGNIMPQVSIDPLDCKCIAFVAHISDVTTRIDYINITQITVSTIIFSIRSVVNNTLDSLRRFIKGHIKPHDLPRLTTNHGHQIDVFSCFSIRFTFNKPIQLVEFQMSQRVFHIYFVVFFIQL